MTTVEEVCAEVVGRTERVICRGCGAVDIEYDRSGIGHAIAGSPPDQCGPVETIEEDQLCGHPESEHGTAHGAVHCAGCCTMANARPLRESPACAHAFTEAP